MVRLSGHTLPRSHPTQPLYQKGTLTSVSQMGRAEGTALTSSRTDEQLHVDRQVPDDGTQEEGVCLAGIGLLNWGKERQRAP